MWKRRRRSDTDAPKPHGWKQHVTKTPRKRKYYSRPDGGVQWQHPAENQAHALAVPLRPEHVKVSGGAGGNGVRGADAFLLNRYASAVVDEAAQGGGGAGAATAKHRTPRIGVCLGLSPCVLRRCEVRIVLHARAPELGSRN